MNLRIAIAEEIALKLFDFNINIEKIGFKNELIDILSSYNIERIETVENTNIDKIIDMYISAKKVDGLAEKTLSEYLKNLRLFSRYINKNVTKITIMDIREYLQSLTESRKLKDSTLSTYITILRSFFKWLTEEEIIRKNPMLKIKPIHVNKRNLRDPMDREEFELFKNACKSIREKAIVELYYSTGCRLSELINITLNDIDFISRSIKVIGKGGSQRIVYFSVRAKIFLEEYLRTRKGNSNFLFIGEIRPYNRLKSRAIELIISNIGKRANLNDNICPHKLRHTFATDVLNSGMNIATLQKALGHSSINTTQIYASVNQETLRFEYNRVMQ